MTSTASDQLLAAVAELRSLFPDWRIGQLVANLTQAAGRDTDGAIWDVEDDELLAAARRLIDRNRAHRTLGVEQGASPEHGNVNGTPTSTALPAPRIVN
jgi:hypothetical protein